MNFPKEVNIPLQQPLFRGERRLRLALVGISGGGKSTIFKAVSSTAVNSGKLAGSHQLFDECKVQIGLDEASVVDLPSIDTLVDLPEEDLLTLKYLLWGDQRPPVSAHEPGGPPAPFAQPDVIVQVMDAAALGRHLELFLEISTLGKPMVIALNRMDEAWNKGLHINTKALSKRLGVPVVATVAHMGQGLADLFAAAVDAVRQGYCPLPQRANQHICHSLQPLSKALAEPEIHKAFRVPHEFLLTQLAANDRFAVSELEQHFPEQFANLMQLRRTAEQSLPRALHDEIHADRHHRAASLREAVSRTGAPHEGEGWRYWLDELFLHPQWGLLGSMAVFAAVLFVVFEVSAWLDSITAARLVDLVAAWQPQSTGGVVGRAVVDGLIGLLGIVVPYMIPLVLLLVTLEHTGVMQRIAFVVDRGFHQIGLHGAVAVPFLLGLGCNVPAISSVARNTHGRDRFIASLLITFVPCSARSAVILALAGKYLGGLGVFAIFSLTIIVIAILGRLLKHRYQDSGPGQVQDIPPYAMPQWRPLLYHTWLRTRDILTIVTPLLVGGSVILALLNHVGADDYINTAFIPVTSWWLGLPVVLGVPILFGILRKELSLLMIYQALGTFDVGSQLDWIQIMTFLIFLTFYIPCVSTFAVMLNTIGRKLAVVSISVSVGVALLISGVVRLLLEGFNLISPV
ncbi:MAG: ferrous iron transporter B [Gammaproteobacteria bacterium]|nr:ferrous iron transporter B [Gammaproteobacteria bacterium]